MDKPRGSGPLEGVRVIDLTTVLMGPYATRTMGDLGADVIRIEPPDGDPLRDVGPARSEGMGWFALNLQRNKRCITIDLKVQSGRDEFFELIASADVFVTNVRGSALKRLGICYDAAAAVNPSIIYCMANGFASEGPFADRAAYDDVVQAMSGLASMYEWSGGEPAYVPSVLGDKVAALHITYATIAALYQRQQTGEGTFIEVPMAETLAAFNLVEHLAGQTFEPQVGVVGYERLRSPYRAPRRAADGWFCFLPYSDRDWQRFFQGTNRDDLLGDERVPSRVGRTTHADELWAIVHRMLEEHPVEHWLKLCAEQSIPAAPIVKLDELADHEQFRASRLIETVEHPTEGAYRWVNHPVRFANVDHPPRRHAARPDEHGDEIRAELRNRP